MNILPHKSWHVRNKNNIERVRRDEAKAAEEEKERLRKIALAEQEARTELLRKRAKKRHADDEIEHTDVKVPKLEDNDSPSKSIDLASTSSLTSGIYTESGNINFFQDIEAGDLKQGKNKEHEEEKKAEKEKWEKDIGLLTYLGQSAIETQEKAPWYLSSRREDKDSRDPVVKDRKLKESLDPLHRMKSYVHKTKRKDKKHKHDDKDKHHRHKHKKSKKEKSSKLADKHSSSTKTVEQLRAERLKREAQEKQRTMDLLTGGQGRKEKAQEEPVNERERGYNSVFNPELVRKKRDKHSYEQYSD